MGDPRSSLNPTTNSVGFTAKVVTVASVSADGRTAVTVDRQNTQTQVSMLVQRSKGPLPAPGERWVITQDLGAWSFAAFVGSSPADFSAGPGGSGTLVTISAQPPPSPRVNDVWLNGSQGNEALWWNGTSWVAAQFGTEAIADRSITAAKIAPASITAAEIAPDAGIKASQVSFTAADINGATIFYGTSQPQDPSGRVLWINPDAGNAMSFWDGDRWTLILIGSGAIAPASITAVEIAPAAGITQGQINFTASDIGGMTTSVSFAEPASPAVNDLWFDGNSAFQLKQWNGSNWAPYQFGTQAIAAKSVTAALIAAHTITAAQVAAGTITANEIAAATITASNIAANTITAAQIAANTITAAQILANTITAAQIAANTITAAQIAANTITAAQIAAATITATQIAAGTITAAQIQAGSLTSAVIGNLGACLNVNPFFNGASSAGWSISGTSNTFSVVAAGTLTLPPYQGYAAQVVFVTAGASSDKFNAGTDRWGVIVGNRYVTTAWVYSSVSVTVNFGIEFRNAAGSPFSTLTTATAVTANTWTPVFSSQVAPATAATGDITFWTSAATTLDIQAAQAFPQIPGIVDATTILGAQLILTGTQGELLAYSGTPASGNLTASLSGVAGSDGFSNAYGAGLTIGLATAAQVHLWYDPSRGWGTVDFPLPGAGAWPFQASIAGTAAGTGGGLLLNSPHDSTVNDRMIGILFSGGTNESGNHSSGWQFVYQDSGGGNNTHVIGDYSGTSLYVVNRLNAVKPGTGTSVSNPAQVEPWHVVGTGGEPAYGTGFGAAGGDQSPRFRLEPDGGGMCRLDGVVATTAGTAANATMFTLPAAYRPGARKRFDGVSSSSGYVAGNPGATLVQISTAGVVSCVPACSGSGQVIVLEGILFPVD